MKPLTRIALLALLAAGAATTALAQPTNAGGGAPAPTGGLWSLFVKSFDLFSILLLLGSVAGVAAIFMCVMDVREQNITPPKTVNRLKDLAKAKRWEDLSLAVHEDESFVGRVIKATLNAPAHDRAAMREAAELAASEESARWFRKIDVLNVIGNLGPLVGLAGTVYGMILAFTSLGEAGGQAGPGDLSLGISKALFHTLLGLCLAIPCLLIYGLYRGNVDRLCTRGIVAASEIIERLPIREPHDDSPVGAGPRSVIAGTIKAPAHT